ncbi:metal ABC transporter solute-binding protein, Zn/Mn family [Thiofilum flexile]|uniref:metal ABC transporter solute-binding protein, Zn/Mn family n=1 Tax=Thiofilum flexile TaxID=125627 RepID=UPI00036C1B57|nr:zinc ABC transporter substrate-binding protein [Thiofilum flexile]
MLLLSACNSADKATEAPLIISTIKPIQSMTLAITAGTPLQTRQLLPDNVSPHQYSVRPSDASALAQAEVIIRIDAEFEAQLDKALQQLKPQQQLLTLSAAPHITLLSTRDLSDSHHEDEHHEHGIKDLHLWLDADNGIAMAQAITQTLSQRYPQYAKTFNTNAEPLIAAIQQADQSARQQLLPFKGQGYITFHDAWQYFDRRYGIQLKATVGTGLGHQVSAKHLQSLYQTVQQDGVKCLLYEPQFSPTALASLVAELNLHTATLDGLGSQLPLTTRTYPELLVQAADQLAHCLQP